MNPGDAPILLPSCFSDKREEIILVSNFSFLLDVAKTKRRMEEDYSSSLSLCFFSH